MEISHHHYSVDLERRAMALREAHLSSVSFAQVPNVDPFLAERPERLPAKLTDLVDHVAFLSHLTTHFVRDINFNGPVIMLGRDAGPVAIGVGWCAKRLGLSIPLRLMDISNKFFKGGWDFTRDGKRIVNDSSFIERLNRDSITQKEARSSLFWKFFKDNELGVTGRCLLVDNGVNGTLLSRLNHTLNICAPELEIHNALFYYSGAMEIPGVHTIVQRQPRVTGTPTSTDFEAIGQFSQCSVKVEGWAHPYPSLSHFEMVEGRAVPAYEPSREMTSEGRVEAEIDWKAHSIENLRALQKLRAQILS